MPERPDDDPLPASVPEPQERGNLPEKRTAASRRGSSPPRIHLTAPASSARDMLAELRIEGGIAGLTRAVQAAVGPDYRVTVSRKMLLAAEDETAGGRSDDPARIAELGSIFADDNVAALVTVRGGAWLARLLNRIPWEVLGRRRRSLHIFGFSEITPLVLIAGSYPQAVGIYDLGPGFLYGGLKRWARLNISRLTASAESSADWQSGFAAGYAAARYRESFLEFFREVVSILEGRGTRRRPEGRLLAGRLPGDRTIRVVGGNLSLLAAMVGSPHARCLDPVGRWLAIEDVNESCEQIDRMLAGLSLAGLLERAEGLILGDFHKDDTPQTEAVFRLLKHHLPRRWNRPIIRLDNFGHVCPIAPLPMHRPLHLRAGRAGKDGTRVVIDIPWKAWRRQ